MFYEYLDPTELSEKLSNDDIAIVDVRDEDFNSDGHIPHAVNAPSEKWDDDEMVDNLIKSHEQKSMVVFHCRMSQVRGPSCATRYIERRAELLGGDVNDPQSLPKVTVLAGGFKRWKQLYGETEGKIEN